MLFILDLDAGGVTNALVVNSVPAHLEHRPPCFDGVVEKHPPPRLRDWVVGWSPVKRPQDHPLPVGRWRIRFELNDLLLVGIGQPSLAVWFLRRDVD